MCLYPGGLGIRLGRKNLYVCETVITTELFFRIHRFIFFSKPFDLSITLHTCVKFYFILLPLPVEGTTSIHDTYITLA